MTKRSGRGIMGVSRRTILAGAAATGAAAGVGAALPRLAVAQSRPPVRIGMLNSYSKVFAFLGDSTWKGLSLYFEQNNWEAAGRKIELIKEDDELSPQVGLDKARKLVERDKVDFIFGLQASNVALAVAPYAKQSKTITLINAGVTSLNRERSPYIFRPAFSAQQLSAPMADWIYDNFTKEIVATASDYAAGRDVIAEFKSAYEKRGGKIIKEVYPPLGTADYSAYLSQIKAINPPATYNFYAGADAVRFVNQYASFGLKEAIPLTGWTSLVSADVMGGLGRNAIGCITSSMYTDTLDTPENKAFVAGYRAKYQEDPNFYSDFGFTGAQILRTALMSAGGDTSDKERVSKAIASATFADPRGPFSFDPVTHNPTQNVYILKVADAGDRIANQVIHTAPGVRDPA